MTWRVSVRAAGAAFALASVAVWAQPASAQYEQVLAGIRLNSKSSTILARYGNPNEVVIGDIGIRGVAPSGGQAGQGGAGAAGAPGADGDGGGPAGMGMMSGSGPSGGMMSASGPAGGGRGMGGGGGGGNPYASNYGSSYGRGGGGGGMSMGSMAGAGGGDSAGGMMSGSGPAGMGGAGGGGAAGSVGGGTGPFGSTVSPLARQQEVTWVYTRKVKNNLISYEFLVGPNGQVSQIRVTGYGGGNARTKRGITLGSTYKDVVRVYGYPEEHSIVGRVLVASYRKNAHVQFQFLNERGQTNLMAAGNKVIAITIATVE